MSLMANLSELKNTVLVQLFKHVPWLSAQWARRHRFIEAEDIPWAPVKKPMRETVIALVTTAGVHLKTQPPFDMDDPDGDPSYRVILSEVTSEALVMADVLAMVIAEAPLIIAFTMVLVFVALWVCWGARARRCYVFCPRRPPSARCLA